MRSSVSLDRSEVGLLAGVQIVDMPCDMSAFRCLLKQIPSTTKQRSVAPVGKRKIRRRRSVVVPTAPRPAADFELTSWPRRDWQAYTDLRPSSLRPSSLPGRTD